METIKQRLLQFVEYKKISNREFCRKCDVSSSFLANRTEIGSDKLLTICTTFPELSLYWLVLGKGKMLQSSNAGSDYIEMREDILELIKSQQQTILLQQKLINKKEGEKLDAAEDAASADAEETA